MVLAVLVLGLPKAQQKKALRYGIVGAFAFRALATLLAVYLIRLGWVKLVGAGYLLYLAYQHFGGSGSAEDRAHPAAGAAVAGPDRVLGDGRQGRAHRHRVRDRLDSRRGRDVAEAAG